jgi:molecular chaperone HscA
MALLQIAEPGMSTAPHEHRLAVGIDLGTTHSLVASVRSGSAECLPDSSGRVILPSVVRYGETGVKNMGEDALACADTDPFNTVFSVKRLMGRGYADVQGLNLPYRVKDSGGMVEIETDYGTKSPVEVSADILRNLRKRAEATLGGELVGAVITVPAYFDDAQRQGHERRSPTGWLERVATDQRANRCSCSIRSGSKSARAVCGVRPRWWHV